MSIRFSHRVSDGNAKKMKDDILKYVSKSPWHISSGGHNHAFGITLENTMPEEDFMTLIEGIIDEITAWDEYFNIPY